MESRSELGNMWLGPRTETQEEFNVRFKHMVSQLTKDLTMSVRAKFKVTRVEIQSGSKQRKNADGTPAKDPVHGGNIYDKVEQRTIVAHPVYESSPDSENSKFWDATPSGELRLGTVNPEAWKMFEIDKEYYIDISPAE